MSRFAMRPLCRCGHVDSTHNTSEGGPYGHCDNPRCKCPKFRPRKHRVKEAK